MSFTMQSQSVFCYALQYNRTMQTNGICMLTQYAGFLCIIYILKYFMRTKISLREANKAYLFSSTRKNLWSNLRHSGHQVYSKDSPFPVFHCTYFLGICRSQESPNRFISSLTNYSMAFEPQTSNSPCNTVLCVTVPSNSQLINALGHKLPREVLQPPITTEANPLKPLGLTTTESKIDTRASISNGQR